MNQKTKVHGAYQQENIDSILETRDKAANSLYGKCAKLMCRFDTMFYEGSLTQEENQQREYLFNKLKERFSRIKLFDDRLATDYDTMLTEDDANLRNILDTNVEIMELNATMNSKSDRTVHLDRFRRILRNFDSALIRAEFSSEAARIDMRRQIQIIVNSNVEQAAHDYSVSYPWSEVVNNYQKKLLKEFIVNSF